MANISASRAAEPWLAPGSQGLRHDLAMLADAGLLTGPQSMWPVAWPDIARDLARELPLSTLTRAEEQARLRVLRAVQAAAVSGFSGTTLRLAGASEPLSLRGYATTPREEGEVGVVATWLGDRVAGNLQLTLAADARDGQDLRLDGSYLGVTVGNFMFAVGAQERWWGPGWDGSLILGTNARPLPALSMERKYADAPRWRLLRWVGPWRASFFLGRAEGSDVAVADVRVFGARVAFKPRSWLELAVTRTAQWCGEGRPCGFDTFGDLLVGRDNRDGSLSIADEPGNQLAGYDLRVRSPWRRLPLAVYGQFIGEDEASGLPSKFLGLLGAEIWGSAASYGSWRARLEYADTTCVFTRQQPQFGCAYRNGLYPQGYSYRGRILGHAMDNDSRMATVAGLWTLPNGATLSLLARDVELNRDGDLDPTHRLSPRGAAELRNLELQVELPLRRAALTMGVGYDDYTRSAGGSSELRGFVSLGRGL